MLIESIAIGLLFGFVFYEWIGFSVGGFVVPGYIALYWNRPSVIVITLGISLLTYCIVSLLTRVTILYGRRRFILIVLVSFALQWLFRMLIIKTHVMSFEIDTIGYIIPGLIANEIERQRIVPTLASLLIVSALVRLTLIVLGLL